MRKITSSILNKIDEIESKENVRIIYAVESGSRAWGFASSESDYDVRFIYVHPLEHYLKLDSSRDIIEYQLDEVFDINGWDIQKTLRLAYSSNTNLLEWNHSPIVYKKVKEFDAIGNALDDYFSAKYCIYHYLNTAINNYRSYLTEETVRLKRYLYVIRPLLACRWILSKNCLPPIVFSELFESQLEEDMKPIINSLVELKISSPEVTKGKRIDRINEFIDSNLVILKNQADAMPREPKPSWDKLNELFLSIVR